MSEIASAVDIVFAKLTFIYGVPKVDGFFRGMDLAEVKRHWVHELRGFTVLDVFYALEHLPPEGIPNVLQFKALCQRRPLPALQALSGPAADPARVRACAVALQAVRDHLEIGSATAWMDRLEARIAAGEKLSRYQRECLAEGRRAHPKREPHA